eukprot:6302972-Prymnesium_polylepis.1
MSYLISAKLERTPVICLAQVDIYQLIKHLTVWHSYNLFIGAISENYEALLAGDLQVAVRTPNAAETDQVAVGRSTREQ